MRSVDIPGTKATNDDRLYVRSLEDGRLVLGLREMDWETEFFKRRFGRLEIDTDESRGVEANALDEALKAVLSFGDKNGFEVIELQVDESWIHHICLLEDNGFRLVDTKLRFLTLMTKAEIESLPRPIGDLTFASKDMKDEILDVTQTSYTHNPSFKSRFNNDRYFSRLEAERYYAAWIESHIGDARNLFAVMRDEGKVVGYLLYKRIGEYRGIPLYKGVLNAVAPEYRGKGIYFDLISFVYRHFPEREVYLDTTTQLTNLTSIKNYIKTQKTLDQVTMIFYRVKEEG
jgi:GNAT superfamily N-acetyltransferase